MRQGRVLRGATTALLLAAMLSTVGAVARAQDRSDPQAAALAQSIRDLQAQIEQLRSAVTELRSEAAEYHAENVALRQHLAALQDKVVAPAGTGPVTARVDQATGVPGVAEAANQEQKPSVQEQLDLLAGKIDEQYQTKVESASKYRVRLSGMVLFNMFSNRGTVDNIDYPHVADLGTPGQRQTSLGGSLRQSLLGLEAFGPTIAGAKSSADIQFDFAGGFPRVPDGVTFGIMRLRTATLRLDWANTSVVGGQDGLFFAPLSPTSFASVAVPPLAYTGNLWGWTPQLRVEHRFNVAADSTLTVQGGVLDPLSGEISSGYYYRTPQAGELARMPALASRVAFTTNLFGQPMTVGVGGYYTRQNWGFDRIIDGWAGTSDVTVPLGRRFSLSGEFYRGRAIGGLGGALGRSIIASGPLDNPATVVRGLDDIGGWSQLKFKASSKLEFNVAAGQDSAFRNEVLQLPAAGYCPAISRNRSALGNFIYHPRSDLLFSLEYARLRTNSVYDYSSANHFSLSMGILF